MASINIYKAIPFILLRRICGVRWFDYVTNAQILRRASQQSLSKVVSRRRLTLFDHLAGMEILQDTSRGLSVQVP